MYPFIMAPKTNRHRTWELRRRHLQRLKIHLRGPWTQDNERQDTFEPNGLVAREWAGSVHTSLPGDEIKVYFILEVSHISNKKRKKKLPSIAMYKLCIIMTIVVIDSTLYDIISSLLEPHLEVLCQETMDIKERS